MTGPGGPLDERVANRGIYESDADRAKYLKKLNARPALVLNADYQVGFNSQVRKKFSFLKVV